MSFNGSLLQMGADNFPLSFVYKDSYKISPNRRMDLDSSRNANGVLMRTVLDHAPSTISFQTKPMFNQDVKRLMDFIRSHYINENEKKVLLTYYCPDLDDYRTGEFYIPDIEFPIMEVDVKKKKIRYDSISLEFIEY